MVPLEQFVENPPEVHSENIFTDIDENFPYEKVGIGRDYQWRVGDWQIPIYDIDGRIIWGIDSQDYREFHRNPPEKKSFLNKCVLDYNVNGKN